MVLFQVLSKFVPSMIDFYYSSITVPFLAHQVLIYTWSSEAKYDEVPYRSKDTTLTGAISQKGEIWYFF